MVAEGLPPLQSPGEPDRLIFLSDIERAAFAFSENNLAIQGLLREQDEREAARRRQLEDWQEHGTAVPLRGWAKFYLDPKRVVGEDESERLRYSDGEDHDDPGGWIPPDRYIVEALYDDAIEGLVARMRSALDASGYRYDVLARTMEWVDDATLLRHRQSAES